MFRSRLPFAVFVLLLSLLAGCSSPGTDAEVDPIVATPTAASEESSTDTAILVPTATAMQSEADAVESLPNSVDLSAISLELEEVAGGMTKPLYVTHAGDGSNRLFVLEQGGTIQIIENGVLHAAPFLDISGQVNDGGNEQGLLGMAFAPDYAASGIFYVNYTAADGSTQVSRFRVSDGDFNLADPASEERILTVAQPARNHNGGQLAFGPDGMLYIGMGDGGGANDTFGHGQNPDSLLGKLLRIDVSSVHRTGYSVPEDNPWVAADWNDVDVRDEILAVGLRNPWRFSFDRATGDLWIADVGQNQYEEVNVVATPVAGPYNFGWPIMEGSHCFQATECNQSGLVLPVAEYRHEGHCSVTGGYVYRGTDFPELRGVYLYGDYCSGTIWGLAADGSGSQQPQQLLDSGAQLSSFGEDERGEVYLTDIAAGTVARLTVAQ